MKSPESSEPVWESSPVPDDPYEALLSVEHLERITVFEELNERIEHLCDLSQNPLNRRSYHTTFPKQDVRRHVFFGAYDVPGFGRLFRIVVNDRSTDTDFTERLHARDYVYAGGIRAVSLSTDYSQKLRATKRWERLEDLMAPFLALTTDSELVFRNSPNYKPDIPQQGSHERSLLELITQRRLAQDLNEVVSSLSQSTHNEWINLERIKDTLA